MPNRQDLLVMHREEPISNRPSRLAKLSRPRLYQSVPRERLFCQLDSYRSLPITLVAAPPGAGKTTLIASYLESRKLGGIWYQVDPGDADPSTFFHFLGLAERDSHVRLRKLPPLPPLTPEFLPDLQGFSRRFFRELFSRLEAPTTVVFDNFQEAGEDGPFHAVLVAALDEVPPGVHVFLVSRHPPPDRYARLAANRAMALLDWEALKLTEAESQSIANAAGLPIDTSMAGLLHERSGGWAAGLVLLTEHLRRGRAFDRDDEPESLTQVFAYFAGQLFDQAPADNRRMLMQLSFLASVSEAHAREITGSDSAPRLLEQLYRRHLFIDCRRGTQPVYVFHALFRAFLQHRAQTDLSPEQRAYTTRLAAALLQKDNQVEAAMPLYAAAQDYAAAQRLVQQEAGALIGQGRWKVVVDWIAMLPENLVADSPWLLHWLGSAYIGVDPARGRDFLQRGHERAQQQSDTVCRVLCAAGMVESYFLEYSVFTPIDPWIEVLECMFAPDFAFPNQESELRAQSAMLIAATYRWPDHPRIDDCMARVRDLLITNIDVNLRVSAGTFLTIYGSFTGHLETARWAAHFVAPLLSDSSVHIFRKIFAWAVICWYSCNSSDYELGDRAVASNQAMAVDDGMHIAERFACILGYFLDMDRRDIATASRRVERFAEIMIPSQPYEAASIVNMRSWLGVFTDDAAQTQRHSREAVRLYNEAGSIPHIMVGMNALIWGCVESGDESGARAAIVEHRHWSSRRNVEWARWAPDAAEALLALRAGDEAMLRERLAAVFAAERHRLDQYGHQLAWCRGWASILAAEALRRDIEAPRVRRFIREFDLAAPIPELETWPWPIKIYTLGRFSLLVAEQPVTFAGKAPRKPLALLKALIAFGGCDVRDYQLIDALWPAEEGDAARDAFRVALHRLRKLLSDPHAVLVEEGRITLNPRLCWVDTVAFESMLGGNETRVSRSPQAHVALELYGGEFLPGDRHEPWTAPLRERVRAKFMHQFGRLGADFERRGEWQHALELYLRGLDADALTESFYQGLMRCHAALGRPADAASVYQRLERTLSAALGKQPSASSRSLYRTMLGDPSGAIDTNSDQP
jgi:DNA-binding SARP family transcriptional activator